MLDTVIANNETHYDEIQIGQILADSDVDLGDEEACVEVLIARGIRPWQFGGSLLQARIEAHNIRTLRAILRPSIDKISEGPLSLLTLSVLGPAALLGLASEARASEHGSPFPTDYPMVALIIAVGLAVMSAVLVILFKSNKE
jgi:hypothetical protein